MNKTESRKTVSLISTLFGLINSAITIFLTYLIRSIVLKEFGVEYVGLYSLLSQTIGLLAGLDGGVSSALFIRMHRPIAKNNIEEIQDSYFLIRVVYHVRGALVLIIGLIVALFLPSIANTTIDMKLVYSCYVVFLVLNSVSYCFIYDYFMLETIQKRYIASAVVCVVNIVVTSFNVYYIYRFHNYFLYITIACTNQVISYFLCRIVFRKLRREYYKKLRFEAKHKKDIISMLGMALHTFSNIMITNSDTIVMSAILSLAVTGYYANYYLIVTGVSTLAMQLTLSIKDPFRNMAMTSSDETVQVSIKRIVFLYVVVIGSMGITYTAMADFFVNIFWGPENVITDYFTVYLLAISFYSNIISLPIVEYYYCKEYYRYDKISPVIEIVMNIIISIILAKLIGLNGIIIGTIATYIYRFIHRARMVYGKFSNNGGIREILILVVKSFVIYLFLSFTFRSIVCKMAHQENIFAFICWAVLIFVASFFAMCCLYMREGEMKYYKSYFLEIINKITKR